MKKQVLTDTALHYCKADIDLFCALCKSLGKTPSGMLMTLHRNCAPILATTVVAGLIENYTGLEQHYIISNTIYNPKSHEKATKTD